MAYYINNEVLRNCIAQYNATNIYDKLEWVPKYVKKFDKQFSMGKITKEEHDKIAAFIKKKMETRTETFRKYDAMTDAEKIAFEHELEHTKTELYGYFQKIAKGRANSMYIQKDPNLDVEERNDIIVDAIIAMFQYCSRYDTDRGTSTFCYMTEIATNSIRANINRIKRRKNILVTGCDFIDNMDGDVKSDDFDLEDS